MTYASGLASAYAVSLPLHWVNPDGNTLTILDDSRHLSIINRAVLLFRVVITGFTVPLTSTRKLKMSRLLISTRNLKRVLFVGSKRLSIQQANQGRKCENLVLLDSYFFIRNIQYYADKVKLTQKLFTTTMNHADLLQVHNAKGYLLVDSTFGPPPLQYPFSWGADCVMHSGKKYGRP